MWNHGWKDSIFAYIPILYIESAQELYYILHVKLCDFFRLYQFYSTCLHMFVFSWFFFVDFDERSWSGPSIVIITMYQVFVVFQSSVWQRSGANTFHLVSRQGSQRKIICVNVKQLWASIICVPCAVHALGRDTHVCLNRGCSTISLPWFFTRRCKGETISSLDHPASRFVAGKNATILPRGGCMKMLLPSASPSGWGSTSRARLHCDVPENHPNGCTSEIRSP